MFKHVQNYFHKRYLSVLLLSCFAFSLTAPQVLAAEAGRYPWSAESAKTVGRILIFQKVLSDEEETLSQMIPPSGIGVQAASVRPQSVNGVVHALSGINVEGLQQFIQSDRLNVSSAWSSNTFSPPQILTQLPNQFSLPQSNLILQQQQFARLNSDFYRMQQFQSNYMQGLQWDFNRRFTQTWMGGQNALNNHHFMHKFQDMRTQQMFVQRNHMFEMRNLMSRHNMMLSQSMMKMNELRFKHQHQFGRLSQPLLTKPAYTSLDYRIMQDKVAQTRRNAQDMVRGMRSFARNMTMMQLRSAGQAYLTFADVATLGAATRVGSMGRSYHKPIHQLGLVRDHQRRVTILGENMRGRVIPFAKATGARTLPWATTQKKWMEMSARQRWKANDRMLRMRINQGDRFRYIGQDQFRNRIERQKFDLTRSELLRLRDRNIRYQTVPRMEVFRTIGRP